MTRSIRTDIHRPGAIVPANYRHVMFFGMAHSFDGQPMPSWAVDCEHEWTMVKSDQKFPSGEPRWDRVYNKHTSDSCCVAAMRKSGVKFVNTGAPGKCSVCGANFVHGAVFAHTNGDHLFIGHQCADKYEMQADWSSAELQQDRLDRATSKVIAADMNRVAREEFLAKHPGLAEAIQTRHHIVADIRERFTRYCTMSDKQVALVLKLHQQVTNPKPKVEEVHVAAPTGRVEFTGEVVSVKEHESDWGMTCKITVKVSTPAGTWLAWGTCPRNLLCETREQGKEISRGYTVCLKATLKPGRDAHFAIMSRPTGSVVAAPATEKKVG